MHNIHDKTLGMALVQVDGLQLENMNVDLKNEDDIVEAAVRQNPMALKFANERNRLLVLDLVVRDGCVLSLLPQEFK